MTAVLEHYTLALTTMPMAATYIERAHLYDKQGQDLLAIVDYLRVLQFDLFDDYSTKEVSEIIEDCSSDLDKYSDERIVAAIGLLEPKEAKEILIDCGLSNSHLNRWLKARQATA